MCTTSVPYFKDIIVMAFNCKHCGAKSTDVKVAGAMSKHGKRMTLNA